MLNLNSSEQLKLDVISKLHAEKINVKQAIKILNKSESTIFRYLREFRLSGASFVKHKNSNKCPQNRTDKELEEEIIKLCKGDYKNFNRTHAREEILAKTNLKVTKSTFNRICNRNALLLKRVKKRKPKNRRRRERMKQVGIMLQLDGSPHRWFGRNKTCLVIIIDDATSDILYGEFSPTETTFACMNVVKKVLQRFGSFQVLYTDKAGIFGKNPVNHFDAVKRDGFSSLKECISKFNINIIYAHSPEAKGRVERAFKTLQDRLVAEMELEGIRTIDEANNYFNNVYLKKHRDNFAVSAVDPESGFTPILKSVDLNQYFYMKETRKIKNDHTFQFKGSVYDLELGKESLSGKELEIRSYPSGKVRYYVDEEEVKLREQKTLVI